MKLDKEIVYKILKALEANVEPSVSAEELLEQEALSFLSWESFSFYLNIMESGGLIAIIDPDFACLVRLQWGGYKELLERQVLRGTPLSISGDNEDIPNDLADISFIECKEEDKVNINDS